MAAESPLHSIAGPLPEQQLARARESGPRVSTAEPQVVVGYDSGVMHVARIAGLAIVGALAVPAGAAACSCVAVDVPTKLKTADAAVVGTVTRVGSATPRPDGTTSTGDPITVTIRVARSYKRTIGRTLRVRTALSTASCGLGARKGQRVGILLTRDGSRWTTSLCQRVGIGALDAAARRAGLRKRAPRADARSSRVLSSAGSTSCV